MACFPGVDHGFAPVADPGDPEASGHGIEGLRAVMDEAVEWFLAVPRD